LAVESMWTELVMKYTSCFELLLVIK